MRKLKNEELNRINVNEFKQAEKTPIIIVLDNIRSLNNIGSVYRTSDAFLIEKIYLCGITAKPPHKDIRKTALGATESVEWEYRESTVELIQELKNEKHSILAVEQATEAVMLNSFTPNVSKKQVLIFGNEVKGVSDTIIPLCDSVIEIPQYGTKHSLNISVSVGVVVWDIWNKLDRR